MPSPMSGDAASSAAPSGGPRIALPSALSSAKSPAPSRARASSADASDIPNTAGGSNCVVSDRSAASSTFGAAEPVGGTDASRDEIAAAAAAQGGLLLGALVSPVVALPLPAPFAAALATSLPIAAFTLA